MPDELCLGYCCPSFLVWVVLVYIIVDILFNETVRDSQK